MAVDPKKRTQVTDPIEAAKLAGPQRESLPEAPAAPVLRETEKWEPGPPAPSIGPKRYRVKRAVTIGLGGQLVKLYEGTVLSESSHGPEQMRSVLDNPNVALEEVVEE